MAPPCHFKCEPNNGRLPLPLLVASFCHLVSASVGPKNNMPDTRQRNRARLWTGTNLAAGAKCDSGNSSFVDAALPGNPTTSTRRSLGAHSRSMRMNWRRAQNLTDARASLVSSNRRRNKQLSPCPSTELLEKLSPKQEELRSRALKYEMGLHADTNANVNGLYTHYIISGAHSRRA